jgi:hypothetical protein
MEPSKRLRATTAPHPPSPPPPAPGLDSLPTAVAAYVFAFLTIDAHGCMTGVARKWAAIVRMPAASPRVLAITAATPIHHAGIRAARPYRLTWDLPSGADTLPPWATLPWPDVRELRVNDAMFTPGSTLVAIGARWPRLEAVTLRVLKRYPVLAESQQRPAIFAGLPATVRRLDVALPSYMITSVRHFAAAFPHLTHLRLRGVHIYAEPYPVLGLIRALRHLDLADMSWSTTSTAVVHLLGVYPHLHTLVLAAVSDPSERTPPLPDAAPEAASELRVLHARFQTWTAMRTVLRAVPRLEQASFAKPTPRGFQRAFDDHRAADRSPLPCAALRVLDMSGTAWENDELVHLCESYRMPQLTALDFACRTTFVTAYRPLRALSSLRVLSLCPYTHGLLRTLPPLPDLRALYLFPLTRDPLAERSDDLVEKPPPPTTLAALYPHLEFLLIPTQGRVCCVGLTALTGLELARATGVDVPELRALVRSLPRLRWLALPLASATATARHDEPHTVGTSAKELACEAGLLSATDRYDTERTDTDDVVHLTVDDDGRRLTLYRTAAYNHTDANAHAECDQQDECVLGGKPLEVRLLTMTRQRGVRLE